MSGFTLFFTRSTHLFTGVVLGLLVGATIQVAIAWTSPTMSPPSGNIVAPVTTGAGQIKNGGLTLNFSGLSTLGLYVANGPVGIASSSPMSALGVEGKISSHSTVSTDPGNTVVTKDYVDAMGGGGGGGGILVPVQIDSDTFPTCPSGTSPVACLRGPGGGQAGSGLVISERTGWFSAVDPSLTLTLSSGISLGAKTHAYSGSSCAYDRSTFLDIWLESAPSTYSSTGADGVYTLPGHALLKQVRVYKNTVDYISCAPSPTNGPVPWGVCICS